MPQLAQALQVHIDRAAERRRQARRFLTRATATALVSLAAVFITLLVLSRRPSTPVTHTVFELTVSLEFAALVGLVFLLRSRLRRDIVEDEEQLDLFIAQNDRLRGTSELLRTVLDSSPVAIAAVDPELRVLLWNPVAERMFGWTSEEVIGKLNPLTQGEDEAESLALRERMDRMGRVPSHQTRRHHKNGTVVEINAAGGTLRDTNGAHAGYIMLAGDLTERNKLEAQLRQAQKMEAIGQLAGGVAHDFNNLLTVISSYTELLLDRHQADASTTEQLQEVRSATERAASLTRQLLAFSRQQVMMPRVIDLNTSVTSVERMLRRLLGEDIIVSTRLDESLGNVRADPGQIEQVLVNLAVNARDAMPRGGRLLIETANAQVDDSFSRQQSIGLPRGEYVSLMVSDSGVGMTSDVREHIFEPFFTTKELGKGTGLGLSTVIGIVEQSGGSIFVYSEPGRGTTFKVYLPRWTETGADAAAEPETPKDAATAGGTERVLLVEDDPAVRKVTHAVLSGAGYAVTEAESGGDALRILEREHQQIDIIVTDVVMPSMGGPDLWRAARSRMIETPILYMSGHARSMLSSAELDAPRAGFIEKPFTSAALLGAVRALLDSDS